MTTAFSDPGTHPVAAVVVHFHAELDELEPRLWSMTDRELAHVLPALTRLRHRIAALELAAAHRPTPSTWAPRSEPPTRVRTGPTPPARPGRGEAAPEARCRSRPARDHPHRDDRRHPRRRPGSGDREGGRGAAGDAGRSRNRAGPARRRARRPPAGHPGQAHPRGGRPRRGRGARSGRLSNARKSAPWRTAGSPSPTTGTGSATAGSPFPSPVGAMLRKAVLGVRRPQAPPASGHPRRAGARVLRVRRAIPDRSPPAGWRCQRDRRGEDDAWSHCWVTASSPPRWTPGT